METMPAVRNSLLPLVQPDARPVRDLPGGACVYRLFETWVLEWEEVRPWGRRRYRLTAPEGFEYDGASVPRLFWTPLGYLPDGLQRAGAAAHDLAYRYQGRIPPSLLSVWVPGAGTPEGGLWLPCGEPLTRQRADWLFRDTNERAGVAPAKRWRFWLAVRVGGRGAWRRGTARLTL